MIGDGELFDVSKNLVKSLGLENNIILLGGLERKEIIKHLETAFLFVQHSLVALAMEIAKVLPLALLRLWLQVYQLFLQGMLGFLMW